MIPLGTVASTDPYFPEYCLAQAEAWRVFSQLVSSKFAQSRDVSTQTESEAPDNGLQEIDAIKLMNNIHEDLDNLLRKGLSDDDLYSSVNQLLSTVGFEITEAGRTSIDNYLKDSMEIIAERGHLESFQTVENCLLTKLKEKRPTTKTVTRFVKSVIDEFKGRVVISDSRIEYIRHLALNYGK